MKITKNKVIWAIVVVALLAASFWYGGGAPGLQGWKISSDTASVETAENTVPDEKNKESDNLIELESEVNIKENTDEQLTDKELSDDEVLNGEAENKDSKEITDETKDEPVKEESPLDSRPGGEEVLSATEKIALAKELAGAESSPGVEKGSKTYSETLGMVIDEKTGKDKYLTDPVPEGKPIPVEPQDIEISDVEHTCILSVRCDTILNNIDWLDPEKVELVPEDGVIFAAQEVTFYEGESVFNVLQREMKKAKIHMEFENTPIYNSVYIEGINNLYEFDCGELSGWMYKVNDWFPNYGCSRYQLLEGDVVEWVYTCDLGVDVGGFYAIGEE